MLNCKFFFVYDSSPPFICLFVRAHTERYLSKEAIALVVFYVLLY